MMMKVSAKNKSREHVLELCEGVDRIVSLGSTPTTFRQEGPVGQSLITIPDGCLGIGESYLSCKTANLVDGHLLCGQTKHRMTLGN